MGQSLSIDSDDVKHFRKMVIHTYYGNLEKLQKHMNENSISYQISRNAFLQLCQVRLGKIEAIVDSLQREAAHDKFLSEKMEFFNAVEDGNICLGDTLLHVAARLGHATIVRYLFSKHIREDIPNFQGTIAMESTTNPAIRIIIEDMTILHETFGFHYSDQTKVIDLQNSLRRIWPQWMYTSEDASCLLQVIYGARSSNSNYNKLLKLVTNTTIRYGNYFVEYLIQIATTLLKASDGHSHKAKSQFGSWDNTRKLNVLFDFFSTYFIDWSYRNDIDLDLKYLTFIESTIESCINLAEEHRLHRMEQFVLPEPNVLKKYQPTIWTYRLHPPVEEIQTICGHIHGLENYLHLTKLKVEH